MSVTPPYCCGLPGKTNGSPVARQMVPYTARVTPMFMALPSA